MNYLSCSAALLARHGHLGVRKHMDGNPPAESEEVATLTRALLSNAVVRAHCSLSARGLHNELSRCRCEFPSRQHLLSAAHQVVLCRNSSLDQEAFKAIKRGLSAKLAAMDMPGVWTIGHLVQLLQLTGFVSDQVTQERWGYIDARVAAALRSKEVAQQSNPNAVSSLAVFGHGRRAAASSTLTMTELSESPGSAMVPFDADTSAQLDQSGHLQDLSNLKGEEALQVFHAAFDCQDKGQLQLLVQALVAERDQSRKSREYFRKKASNLSQELSKSKHEAEQLRHGIVHYSKRRKIEAKRYRLTVHGGYKLALSRNLGHGGTVAALQTLDAESSWQTCAFWEHMFSASILASHADFHAQANEAISDLQDEQMPLRFEFQGFSGDATNSNIVQSSKVHTCVVRSAYLVPHVREGQEGWAILQRQSLADVQLLPDSVTGAVIYQMYQKQLRSRVT